MTTFIHFFLLNRLAEDLRKVSMELHQMLPSTENTEESLFRVLKASRDKEIGRKGVTTILDNLSIPSSQLGVSSLSPNKPVGNRRCASDNSVTLQNIPTKTVSGPIVVERKERSKNIIISPKSTLGSLAQALDDDSFLDDSSGEKSHPTWKQISACRFVIID